MKRRPRYAITLELPTPALEAIGGVCLVNLARFRRMPRRPQEAMAALAASNHAVRRAMDQEGATLAIWRIDRNLLTTGQPLEVFRGS